MTVLALSILTSGLVLGVFAMLYGTERRVLSASAPHERRSEHDPAAEPSPVFNLASLAALAVGFGLTAYLTTRFTELSVLVRVLLSVGAGGATLALQSVLIARWAIPSARADDHDQRYLLQGTIGVVVRTASAGGIGEMRYELDGRAYLLPVRSLTDEALHEGAEVVMDRVDDGVAYVESWAEVERRL